MMKFIYSGRAAQLEKEVEQSVVYADEEELAAMEICHPHCIKILQALLESMPSSAKHRAIDVAGGDGRLSINLLVN